jgi:hypothetical protein
MNCSNSARNRSFDFSALNISTPKEPYYALVMQRLGKDIGSMFRKHLNRIQQRPLELVPEQQDYKCRLGSQEPGYGSKARSSRQPALERRSTFSTIARFGWDMNTIVWIGSHLLRRLEHVHNRGYVHRDIVSLYSPLRMIAGLKFTCRNRKICVLELGRTVIYYT